MLPVASASSELQSSPFALHEALPEALSKHLAQNFHARGVARTESHIVFPVLAVTLKKEAKNLRLLVRFFGGADGLRFSLSCLPACGRNGRSS